MRVPWRRGALQIATRVDALADRADDVAVTSPGSQQAIEASESAFEAAEQWVANSPTVYSRRRLLRTSWRLTSAYFLGHDLAAIGLAERCWALCQELLDETSSDPQLFDEIVGMVIGACGSIGPVLALSRGQEAVDLVLATCEAAATRAVGPRGRQARARLAMADLSHQVDELRQAHIDGVEPELTSAVIRAVGQAQDAVEVLRKHSTEGPFEATDLARMLQVRSRLETLAGHPENAAATLDEAIATMTPLAEQGPPLASVLRSLSAERDGLGVPRSADSSGATAPEDGEPVGMGTRAFRRAAKDIGEGTSMLAFPSELTEAQAVVAGVPTFEPHHGLAMAWQARLLFDADQAAEASALASAAARQLMHFGDNPERIQAALTVALTVRRAAAERADDGESARRAELQAAAICALLLARDPTYAADLAV